MAPEVVSKLHTLVTGESKSARKKKGKSEAGAAVPAAPEKTTSEAGAGGSQAPGHANGTESDNSYIRELQKNIRNINKKLNATQKVDSILAANPGVSLDDLVASRKINNDQKAQAEKKPGLQAQLAQLEEQYGHYKKYGEELEAKHSREKELLSKQHASELEALRDTIKAEAALEQQKVVKDKLLAFSRFLRAAAARRARQEDESELSKGFEGALLQVYGGDAAAVAAVEKLVDGSQDKIPSVDGTELDVTYTQVMHAVLEEAPFAAEEAWVDDVAQSQPAPPETEAPDTVSDPTITNAGLTEMNASATTATQPAQEGAPAAPAASSIEPEAANAAATEHWDKQAAGADDPLSESFEMVPRDPTETETPHAAAAVNSTQSWADDATETAAAAAPAPAAQNDGFSEVHHSRGGRGRGGHPSGERGGYRGRGRGGPRGDFGGRGRGGRGRGGEFRGRGGFRGPPRGGEPSA
ncbi:hypothetical protein IAQ61_001970 [Plenodomus lingam]|uniref:YAG7-like dimerisation domain-containing protein n=1 Tax=Leptosphaeria maculans (strain JN3 / isolate v23.1.3 / race Av1-4-5-6-7-8) TaxID=985895 RepID=E4ZGP7_LEPMJ|nr:hypothetical protein LEMA_P065930.1 [Plenodomus lingam JN3]KAH9878697.1 hypothetical protein IAQ61_001970 [Plenodomus lingam]CBX90467.1 hypothetical protein LEMA_P065930.1 [Plenodomus lingam JN3]